MEVHELRRFLRIEKVDGTSLQQDQPRVALRYLEEEQSRSKIEVLT